MPADLVCPRNGVSLLPWAVLGPLCLVEAWKVDTVDCAPLARAIGGVKMTELERGP
jgi:hypothetical protein